MGEGDQGGGKAGQQRQNMPTSPDKAYSGVLQPRVLNQSFTEPIMTDVSVGVGEPIMTDVSVVVGEPIMTDVSVGIGEPIMTGVGLGNPS